LNKVFAEGIVEGRHASPALTAATGGATGAGAGAGLVAGVGAGVVDFVGAGVDVAGVVGVSPLLELLLDPQPLIADTKKNASGANAVNALDRYTIATCS
jgi:hypothetical protein